MTPAHWTVVVPVKRLGGAKTRLGDGDGAWSAAERQELALALALDTLHAVRRAPSVGRVLVVTDEPRVAVALGDDDAHASSGRPAGDVPASVKVVADPGAGLDAAVRAGAARSRGPVAVLLGDVPALRAAELDAALGQAAGTALAVVPDREGTGTVLLTALDPAALVPRFGPGSSQAHQAGGHAVLPVPDASGLRRDVDTPADLAEAVQLGVGRRTAEVLARHTPASSSAAATMAAVDASSDISSGSARARTPAASSAVTASESWPSTSQPSSSPPSRRAP